MPGALRPGDSLPLTLPSCSAYACLPAYYNSGVPEQEDISRREKRPLLFPNLLHPPPLPLFAVNWRGGDPDLLQTGQMEKEA